MCLNNTLAQSGSNYTGIARQDRLRDQGSQMSYRAHHLRFFLLRQVPMAAALLPVPVSQPLGLPSSQQSGEVIP